MSEIKVTYMDHEIEYRESSNDWQFNGRTFYSLTSAKKAVDKLLAESRKVDKEAIFIGDCSRGEDRFRLLQVTSLDPDREHAWCVEGKKTSRERLADLAVNSKENRARAKTIQHLEKQIADLRQRARDLLDSMERIGVQGDYRQLL